MNLTLYPVDGGRGSLNSSVAISKVSGLDFEFIIKW